MGGFEPPTAWFVARYSIQLSYIRSLNNSNTNSNGADGRIRTSDRLVRSQVLYPAELHPHRYTILRNGGEGGIRTLDGS